MIHAHASKGCASPACKWLKQKYIFGWLFRSWTRFGQQDWLILMTLQTFNGSWFHFISPDRWKYVRIQMSCMTCWSTDIWFGSSTGQIHDTPCPRRQSRKYRKLKPKIFGRIGDGGSSAMEIRTLFCLMFRWAKPIPCECGAVPQPFDGTNPLNNDILRPKTWRSQLLLTADYSSARDCVGQKQNLRAVFLNCFL